MNVECPRCGLEWQELDDEIERLRVVILDIARIVENPDDRALQRVRDVTDKQSSVIAPTPEAGGND